MHILAKKLIEDSERRHKQWLEAFTPELIREFIEAEKKEIDAACRLWDDYYRIVYGQEIFDK